LCLVETGTRGLLGAAIGGVIGRAGDRDESHLARRLLPLLCPGMLLLADRAYDSGEFLTAVDATGAKLLIRGGSTRKPAVLRHLADGSYLSDIGGLSVRVIEADLTVRGADGTVLGERYRLITTLLDAHRYPAQALLRLYHERWEIESAFLALRRTQLGGHVLRSQDRAGVEQELWALLTLYQLLRTAMVEAIETRPGLDPDRASFTTALQTARDQLIGAAGITAADQTNDIDVADHVAGSGLRLGAIGTAMLATLLPVRRPRYSNRNVKCSTSRYHARDDGRPALPTTIVAIDITVRTPPINLAPTRRPRTRQGHRRPHEQRQLPPGAVRPATPPRAGHRGPAQRTPPRLARRRTRAAAADQPTPPADPTQRVGQARVPPAHRQGHLRPRYPTARLATAKPHRSSPPRAAGAEANPDGDEERGKVQRPQHSEDERPCPVTSAGHISAAPGKPRHAGRVTSWT